MPQVKDDRKVLEELQRTQQVLYDLTGRIPVTSARPSARCRPRRLARLPRPRRHLTMTALGDPDGTITARQLVDWVVRKASPGGIVVLHMNHKRFATATALPDIIKGLRNGA